MYRMVGLDMSLPKRPSINGTQSLRLSRSKSAFGRDEVSVSLRSTYREHPTQIRASRDPSPGPGYYNVPPAMCLRSASLGSRTYIKQFEAPSPTRYQKVESCASRMNAVKICGTRRDPPANANPGPNAYRFFSNDQDRIHTEFGKAVELEELHPLPGPAEYQKNTDVEVMGRYSQVRSTRLWIPPNQNFLNQIPHDVPGPDYLPPTRVHSCSMRFRTHQPDYCKTPGPKYDITESERFLRSEKGARMNTLVPPEPGVVRDKQYYRRQIMEQKQVKLLQKYMFEQNEIGRKELGIGMENRKMGREERRRLVEQISCFTTFPVSEYVTHFALSGAGFPGILHGKVVVNKMYPHNYPKVVFMNKNFRQPIFDDKFLRDWKPPVGTVQQLLQMVVDQIPQIIEDTPTDEVKFEIEACKKFECEICGCKNAEVREKIMKNKERCFISQ